MKEFSELPDSKGDGTPFDPDSLFYWSLDWKKNIEPYEGKWEKLPKSAAQTINTSLAETGNGQLTTDN